ncbi:extracellular solute-binding protein [Floricoccus penangensis]|uniref:extracellular solute-binding protein n=1 Tax=Floricoccus penangensis TaxID=1859475 RepID=UPI00203C0D24|nr:extracellular solute-binding protein [Floricoccus penangensis]URZ87350.1 extracellular solute-binding protein [Floricoccus penangensis]
MKNWKKLALAGATALAATTLLVGCGGKSEKKSESSGSSDKKVSLKVWVPTDSKKFYEANVKDFESENPNVKLEIIESDASKAQENIKKDPSKAADVFAAPHDHIGQLVESGVLQKIPEQFSKKINDEQIDSAVQAVTYKGEEYAFPFGVESLVYYYNKTKLSADDVKTYEGITSKAKFGGSSLEEVNAYYWAPLFMSMGLDLFGPNGEDPNGTNWNNDKGVSVLQWVADQKNNKNFVNVKEDGLAKFKSGDIAAFQSGPWDLSKAEEAVGKENLGIAVYPKINIGGQEVQQKAFLGVQVFAVNQAPANGDTERISKAYKLAEYFSSEKFQDAQFKEPTRSTVPTNKKLQESDAVKNSEIASAVATMSGKEYSVIMPKIPEMTNFWSSTGATMSGAYTGKIKPDQYKSSLDQLMKDISGQK